MSKITLNLNRRIDLDLDLINCHMFLKIMKMFVETFFIFVTFSSNLGKNRVKNSLDHEKQPTPFPKHIFRERNFWFISRSN